MLERIRSFFRDHLHAVVLGGTIGALSDSLLSLLIALVAVVAAYAIEDVL